MGGVPNNDFDEPELALTTPSFSKMALKGKVSEVAQRFIDLMKCSAKGVRGHKCPNRSFRTTE